MIKNKCVVVLGEGKSETTCDREAIHEYNSKVQKQDGEIVEQVLSKKGSLSEDVQIRNFISSNLWSSLNSENKDRISSIVIGIFS